MIGWLHPARVGQQVRTKLVDVGVAARLFVRLVALVAPTFRRLQLVVTQVFLLGNLSLPLIIGLLAYHVRREKLPLYSIAVASLLTCSMYPWTAITWPMCSLFYFGTVLLAFACFHLLDLPRPRPLAAQL